MFGRATITLGIGPHSSSVILHGYTTWMALACQKPASVMQKCCCRDLRKRRPVNKKPGYNRGTARRFKAVDIVLYRLEIGFANNAPTHCSFNLRQKYKHWILQWWNWQTLLCFDTVGYNNWRHEEKFWPVKIEWWGAAVVVCLERGANDLYMVQLMPLPFHRLLLH